MYQGITTLRKLEELWFNGNSPRLKRLRKRRKNEYEKWCKKEAERDKDERRKICAS